MTLRYAHVFAMLMMALASFAQKPTAIGLDLGANISRQNFVNESAQSEDLGWVGTAGGGFFADWVLTDQVVFRSKLSVNQIRYQYLLNLLFETDILAGNLEGTTFLLEKRFFFAGLEVSAGWRPAGKMRFFEPFAGYRFDVLAHNQTNSRVLSGTSSPISQVPAEVSKVITGPVAGFRLDFPVSNRISLGTSVSYQYYFTKASYLDRRLIFEPFRPKFINLSGSVRYKL
jgi:hypothetical protein